MYRVGDVIEGGYCVREVSRIRENGTVCRCTKYGDGNDVTIECIFLRAMDLPEAADYYEKRKQDVLMSERRSQGQQSEWFEIETEGYRILHVIQDCYPHIVCQILHPTPPEMICKDSEERPGPEAARPIIRRGRRCLKIDIPPPFQHGTLPFLIMLALCIVIFLITTSVLAISSYIAIDRAIDEKHHILHFLLIFLWLFVLPLPIFFVMMLFGQQLLIVTPCTFEVRRTMGRPLRSSADAPPTCDLWKPSVIDRILRRQVKGKTRDLIKAEVKALGCCISTVSMLVLSEVHKRHRLFPVLSLTEQAWLASEITSFLEAVRRREP